MNFEKPENNTEQDSNREDREKFLSEIYEKGRADFVSWFVGGSADIARGWNYIADNKGSGRPLRLFQGRNSVDWEKLKNQGFDGKVVVSPMTELTTVYKDQTTVVKGGLFKRDKIVSERVPARYEKKPVPLSKLGVKSEDEAHIVAFNQLLGVGKAGDFFYDGRPGKTLDIFLALPKKEADELKQAIVEDPSFVRSVISKFNPKLMEFIDKNGGLPEVKKILSE